MNNLERLDGLRNVGGELAFLGGLLQALAQSYDLDIGDRTFAHDVDWEELVRQFCWRTLASERFAKQLPEWQRAFLSVVIDHMRQDGFLVGDENRTDGNWKPQPIINIESEAECNSAIQGILKWLDRGDEDADADAEISGVWKGPLDRCVLQFVKHGAVDGSDCNCSADRERVYESVNRKDGKIL